MRVPSLRAVKAREMDLWTYSLAMGSYPGESQTDINKIQRAKVRAFRKRHGKAVLLDLNRPSLVVKEYHRGMVYNFEGTHVVPEVSERLLLIHAQWREYPSLDLVEEFNREVERLGGFSLYWV